MRHVDDLGIGGLDPDDAAFFHMDLLVVDQHALGVGLGAGPLNRIVDFLFLEVDGLSQRGGPGDVLGHHLDHVPELHERNHGGVPVADRFGRGILHVRVQEQVLVGPDHVERAGGGGEDLGQQLVRVERHRCDQALEFIHGAPDVGRLVGLELGNKRLAGGTRRHRCRWGSLRARKTEKTGEGQKREDKADRGNARGRDGGIHDKSWGGRW